MTLAGMDRKTFIALAAAAGAVVLAILRLTGGGDSSGTVVSATESVPQAEQRLQRLRRLAATVPGKEDLLRKVWPN